MGRKESITPHSDDEVLDLRTHFQHRQAMSELKLFNSLTRQLETFTPVHEGEARVYTCAQV
jgi:hypothetical protein